MNYLKIATEIATLLHEKNAAYGDAINKTADILTILFPNGINVEDYKRVLIMVRMVDKLCREATNSDEENWKDLCGYPMRMCAEYEAERLGETMPDLDISDFPKTDPIPGMNCTVTFAANKISKGELVHFDDSGNYFHVCTFNGESFPATCFGCGKKESL